MFWQPGQTLHDGKYRIEKILGQGGFGTTYKALQVALDRPVVIKSPNEHLQYDPDYPKYLQRFLQEAKLLAKVTQDPHLHIVQVIELFKERDNQRDVPCLVMNFVPGDNLHKYVQQKGALPEAEAVQYIQQVGDALNTVHQAGLVHRDAHPGNILLRKKTSQRFGHPVLIDFGLAAEIVPQTMTSKHFGNNAFAPYEQMRGAGEPTVDIYCLAASLYYLVTGQCPTSSLGRKMFNESLIAPVDHAPISATLNQAILHGLALEPQDRPQSLSAWLSELTPQPSDEDDLRSEKGIDYRELQRLLQAQDWRAADNETYVRMLEAVGREDGDWIRDEEIKTFPCADLKTIDRLWVKYSNGKWGFSVQKQIYVDCGAKLDGRYPGKRVWEAFGDRVGWRKDDNWLNYSDLTFSLEKSLSGEFPVGKVDGWVMGKGGWCVAGWVRLCGFLFSPLLSHTGL